MRGSAVTTLASWLLLTSCANVYEAVQLRSGVAHVTEPATDGGNDHLGYSLGLELIAMYKLDRCWSVGGGAELDLASHHAEMAPATVQYAGTGPRVLVRRELDRRVALVGWTGYDVLGFRAITEPSGDFAGTVSSVKLRGAVLGAAALARIPFSGGELEVGPYFDSGFLHSIEDEARTPFDETGMSVHTISVGVMVQGAFGALP